MSHTGANLLRQARSLTLRLDLIRVQRQFDLRERALRVVEDDRMHMREQFDCYWQRRGRGYYYLLLTDDEFMASFGAT